MKCSLAYLGLSPSIPDTPTALERNLRLLTQCLPFIPRDLKCGIGFLCLRTRASGVQEITCQYRDDRGKREGNHYEARNLSKQIATVIHKPFPDPGILVQAALPLT